MMRVATLGGYARAREKRRVREKSAARFSLRAQVLMACLMALMTRAQLFGDATPFAAACVAAGLFAGWPALPLLAGSLAGARYEVLGLEALLPSLGAAVVWMGYLLIRLIANGKPLSQSVGQPWFRSEDALSGALGALGATVPLLISSGGIAYNLMTAGLAGVIALSVAPLMRSAMFVRFERKILLPDEQLSLLLMLMIALLGVKGIPFVGSYAAAPAAALVVLISGGIGPGAGAMSGILAGTVLMLTGADPFIGASLGLCGLMAGLVRRLGRPASAVAFALGNVLTLAYGMGYTYGALHPVGVMAVGIAYCLLPASFLSKIESWVHPPTGNMELSKFAGRIRANSEKRVRAMGAVFAELSEGYAQGGASVPDEQTLTAQLRQRLCEGCSAYEACWSGGSGEAGRMLCSILVKTLRGEPLCEDTALPPEVGTFCRRKNLISRRLGALTTDIFERTSAAKRRGDCQSIMAGQLKEAASIMSGLGDHLAAPVMVLEDMARVASGALERIGLPVANVTAVQADGLELYAALNDHVWDMESSRNAAKILTSEIGVPLKPVIMNGAFDGEMRFLESPRYTATVGVRVRSAKENEPCGDAHAAVGLTGGRIMLALSDGMGNGEKAARASHDAIRLLKRFLSAGVAQELALDSMNGLLMMLGNDDIYATVDLCVLDLQSGEAVFHKLSACHSVIVRKGHLTHIEGGRLPLGIIEAVKPLSQPAKVQPGDVIVMVTDGLCDSSDEARRAWLDALIRKNHALAPQAMADAILQAAQDHNEKARDDMSVLVARIGAA